jgi:alpha-mannosidase
VPHDGGWREAGVVRRAAELNQPVTALIECFHDGPLPQTQSYVTVAGSDHVVVSVLKRAEDNDGATILRAYETAGQAAEVTIDVLGQSFGASFEPHEIKTLRLSPDADAAVELDLLEWDPAAPPPISTE